MKDGRCMKKTLIALGALLVLMFCVTPPASAQGVDGGCTATVNGKTVDTLTRTNPLVVAKGDTLDLVGTVPASAGPGPSETKIVVEVVGDIPVATEFGTGTSWGGNVTVPNVITQLAPGVYKVKGTAQGAGWICDGSVYVKVEGGPFTAATGIGVLVLGTGIATAIGSRRPKQTQVFHEGPPTAGGEITGGPEKGTRLAADGITLGLFAMLVVLVGYLSPSWVL
jgi:hypothetical protein